MSDTATLRDFADRALRLFGLAVIGTVMLLMAMNAGHSGPVSAVEDGAQFGAPLATDAWISAGLAGCFVAILGLHAIRQRWDIEA